MHYPEIVQHLYQLAWGRRASSSLATIAKCLADLGDPHLAYPVIHVAGTNGKGSVSIKLAAILEQAGYKVGLYTSPHIATWRERIQINGRHITESAVERLFSAFYNQDGLTFFELLTILAFEHFSQEKIDVAVIETGLGGRLDATNVVRPILAAITSISFDHCEILGHTLEKIAAEKAGILKPGARAVIGPRAQGLGIEGRAASLGLTPVLVPGGYQTFREENHAIVRSCVAELREHFNLSEAALERGLMRDMPCRFQEAPLYPGVILDVAHNPDGFSHLMAMARRVFAKKPHVAVGVSKGKAFDTCLKALLDAEVVHLIDNDHKRILPVSQVRPTASQLGLPIGLTGSIRDVLPAALAANERPLLICGSHFIMRDARGLVGIPQECDPLEVQESAAGLVRACG